jgi:spore germination protein
VKTISSTILVLIILVLATTTGYLIYQENKYIPPATTRIKSFAQSIQYSTIFAKEPTVTSEYFNTNSKNPADIRYNAWIPSWAMNSGLKSLEAKKDQFETVSPVFYEMASDGRINVNKGGLDKLKQIVSGTSIKVIPTIAGFDPASLSIVLNDQEKFDRHIAFLLKEVDDNQFDGLDLDYEGTYLKDKEKYFTLLEKLSSELHSRNKLMTVAVLSKWGDFTTYGFMPETREVQDYAKISEYADQVRIMTYDFTGSGGTNPGPIAPLSWMEEVLNYAVKRVPVQKIVMGVHLYGYAWPNGEAGRALDYGQVLNLQKENSSLQTFYNDTNKEGALRYSQNGKTYFGYYATPESIKARIDLAAKYGIHGVAFWRLGDDGL